MSEKSNAEKWGVITLVVLLLVFVSIGQTVVSCYAKQVENIIDAGKIRDDNVDIQDYMSMHSGISVVTGNYINAVLAFLTFLLLVFTLYQAKILNDRYEREKEESEKRSAIERERHEAILGVERDRLKLERIKVQKDEVYKNIDMLLNDLCSLQRDDIGSGQMLSGYFLIEEWKMRFGKYLELAIDNDRLSDGRAFCYGMFELNNRFVGILSHLIEFYKSLDGYDVGVKSYFEVVYLNRLDDLIDMIVGQMVLVSNGRKVFGGGKKEHVEIFGALMKKSLEWENFTQEMNHEVFGLQGCVRSFRRGDYHWFEIVDDNNKSVK